MKLNDDETARLEFLTSEPRNIDIANLREKLQMSVEHLATGPGSQKERLQNVFDSYLIPMLPDNPRSKIERLLAEAIALATSKKDSTGIVGHLYYTLSNSHWRKKRKIAQKIFEAYEIASKAYYQEEANLDGRDINLEALPLRLEKDLLNSDSNKHHLEIDHLRKAYTKIVAARRTILKQRRDCQESHRVLPCAAFMNLGF